EELLIDPVAWQQRQRPKTVAAPKLGKGEQRSGEPDEFGVIGLYLMLTARLDVKTALAAVTGWGGDRYIGYRKHGKECVRGDFVGDTPNDFEELASALEAWAAKGPRGAATVTRHGDRVELSACEAKGGTVPTA